MQAPMGRAVIGGVITSTLLTLVVVPVLYSLPGARPQGRRREPAPARSRAGGGATAVCMPASPASPACRPADGVTSRRATPRHCETWITSRTTG